MKKPTKEVVSPHINTPTSSADSAFTTLIETLAASNPAVQRPSPTRRAFGSNALKWNGKIFAMLVRGDLVLELPAARVAAMLACGLGVPFDAGKGKPRKEWVTVRAPEKQWLALAREALVFASGSRQ